MRIEEIIGHQIHRLRGHRGLTQQELGVALGEVLGREWPRQAISAAEKGCRAFTSAELIAFSVTLGTSVGQLLMPITGDEHIELSERSAIRRSDLIAAILPVANSDQVGAAIDASLKSLTEIITGIMAKTGSLQSDVELLNRLTGAIQEATVQIQAKP